MAALQYKPQPRVKKIQAVAYNGARTVYGTQHFANLSLFLLVTGLQGWQIKIMENLQKVECHIFECWLVFSLDRK